MRNPGQLPECSDAQEPGERIIEYPEWQGYFKGVKGDLVLFNDSDTFNGGFPFAVFDSVTGNKVFEDSATVETSSNVRVFSNEAGYVLEYRRVVRTDCDLHTGSSACWNRIKAAFSLPGDEMPVCTGYDGGGARAQGGPLMSVIAYPVVVTLSPDPVVRAVFGPIRCWPEL